MDDLEAVVAACQDPDIPRFIPFVAVPYGVADGIAFLESVERAWGSNEWTFAICSDSDVLLGVVTLRLRDAGLIGYWLSSSARGSGLMTEAVKGVIAWAREELGVQRFELWTHPDNAASQAVARRAGFARAGLGEHTPPFSDGTTVGVRFELD